MKGTQIINEVLFNQLAEGCLVVGADWVIHNINAVFERQIRSWGRNLEIAKLQDILPEQENPRLYEAIKISLQQQIKSNLILPIHFRDQTKNWLEFNISPNLGGFIITTIDITDFVKSNEQIKKLNRVYALLSDINQTIVRFREPPILFERVCQIAVEKGKFSFACIGTINPEKDSIQWLADAGKSNGFLKRINFDLKASHLKKHPIVRSLSSGQIWVENHLQNRSFNDDWHREVLFNGFMSGIFLPLMVFGKVQGIINLYVDEPDFFDDEELALLSEMAMDLSFALEFTEQENRKKEAEELLKESEEKFRSAFDDSLIGNVLVSPEGLLVKANQAFCNLLGYEENELLGHRIFEFTHPDDLALSQTTLNHLNRGAKTAQKIEKRYIRKDGAVIWGEAGSAPVKDEAGNVKYLVSQLLDITQRKKAEEEILSLNADLEKKVQERTAEISDLYHNAPCGYHSLNREGIVVNINDTELSWLGYERHEVVNKLQFTHFLTEDSVQIFKKNFPNFLKQGYIEDLELDLLTKNRKVLPVVVNATAVLDANGEVLASRSSLINNTQRKQAIMELKQSQALLKAANLELARANKELEAFSYSVSHDLRQPLRAIEGYSKIIENDYAEKIEADGVQLFKSIRANVKKMDHLITDLLALSRINRTELNYTRINMKEMAAAVYEEILPENVHEKFSFVLADLSEAYGDPVLIRQVWANLISNAIKYSTPKETCRVEIGYKNQNGVDVYYVRDNGVGFDPLYAQKLFGVFQRLHRANEFEGTGVGLAIVQRIISRHGGTIWAESQVDQGATFYFSLKEAVNQDQR